jgi:CubicO group peptidase (beta-lactamase class C family)
MYSSPMDYARFLALWMDHGRAGSQRLLQRETVVAALDGMPTGGSYEYGMQWQIFTEARVSTTGLPPFGHGGSDGTIAFGDPDQDVMVLYFTQSRGGSTTRRMLALARAALGETVQSGQ